MLSNQTFIDPLLATSIHQLEQQMKSLLQQKLHIQYNTQFMDEKRRLQMLKANEQQRLELRKIIQKSKLSMVEYLDKQVGVVANDCVRNGKVERKSREKFQPQKVVNCTGLVRQEGQCQQGEPSNQRCSKSRHSQSTNYKSKVYLNPNDKSFQNTASFYDSSHEQQSHDESYSYEEKGRKSCLSTGCRTALKEERVNSRGTTQNKSGLNRSLISNNNNNGSSIMEINEFNLTTNSIPQFGSQQSLPYPNAKSSLLHFLQQQPHTQFHQLNCLFQTKISCLQQKCQSLQKKNSQLLKIIEYQQGTIQELDEVIRDKERNIEEWKHKWIEGQRYWKGREIEVVGDFKNLLIEVEKYKSKISLDLRANMIIEKYKNYTLPELSQLPLTLSYPTSVQKSQSIYSPIKQNPSSLHQLHPQSVQNLTRQDQKIEILELSKQLVQLQVRLKQIQDQNEQLKGERKLLLKKVKF